MPHGPLHFLLVKTFEAKLAIPVLWSETTENDTLLTLPEGAAGSLLFQLIARCTQGRSAAEPGADAEH